MQVLVGKSNFYESFLVDLYIKLTTSKIKKTKNRILAMPIEAPTIPVKPKSPAIIAIMRKNTIHPSINIDS